MAFTHCYGERYNESEDTNGTNLDGSYLYAKTSADAEDSLTMEIPRIGQSFPEMNMTLEDIVVTDGYLTIGAQAGPDSHVFFNEVRLLLSGMVEGFDYGKAYQEVLTGVEPQKQTAKVRAIQLFDLNGRRISAARKGVVIIKKQMSDGTIRTEKVLK